MVILLREPPLQRLAVIGDERSGMLYSGHDASYIYWTSNTDRAIHFLEESVLYAEAKRAGIL